MTHLKGYFSSENEQVDPEVNMNSLELIEYNGFKYEIHHLTTNDGYILGK